MISTGGSFSYSQDDSDLGVVDGRSANRFAVTVSRGVLPKFDVLCVVYTGKEGSYVGVKIAFETFTPTRQGLLLEVYPGGERDRAGSAGCGYLPEVRRIDIRRRVTPDWSV